MKKKENLKVSINRENSVTSKHIPDNPEKVVTEILITESLKIFLKRIFFPDSVDSDPSVTLYGGKCEPTIQYFESHGVIVSKIVCDGKEEKVLIDILITKSGKVVTRKFSYPVNDKVIVETFPFKSDIHVISKIVFSSYSMTETKKILFPISKF